MACSERTSPDPKDDLLVSMTKILEDVRAYLTDDTTTPSHTDGLRFHAGKCPCCESDILGDVEKALANPLTPKLRETSSVC